jgi:hypothetical protein
MRFRVKKFKFDPHPQTQYNIYLDSQESDNRQSNKTSRLATTDSITNQSLYVDTPVEISS